MPPDTNLDCIFTLRNGTVLDSRMIIYTPVLLLCCIVKMQNVPRMVQVPLKVPLVRMLDLNM